MATVQDIIKIIEEIAPIELSKLYCEKYNSYDNSGLILGDVNKEVFSVVVCLDLTREVADEAVDNNADMIISHHPLIFNGLKSITKNDSTGNIIYKLIKNDIAVYAAHLNFDNAPFGVNQILADKLGLVDCKIMQPAGEEAGLGRVGKLQRNYTLKEIFDLLCTILKEDGVKFCGNPDKIINTVGIVCGAGGDMELLDIAYNMGADLYITSEIKHHIALNAKERGIALIDGGHFATENIAIPLLTQLISDYAENDNMDIEVNQSTVNTNPFIYK